ncbi:MAG: 50S ribosomal protein L21 [Patescibacteria group bacterium]
MKYAVVRINGRQYKVSEKEEFLVEKLNSKKLEPEVLLAVDGDKIKIGKPKLADVAIGLKVIRQEEKGEKIDVVRYKAKSRYRKKKGFRPYFSRLLVEKISLK